MVKPQAGSLRSFSRPQQHKTQSSGLKDTVKYKSYSKDADSLLVAKVKPPSCRASGIGPACCTSRVQHTNAQGD